VYASRAGLGRTDRPALHVTLDLDSAIEVGAPMAKGERFSALDGTERSPCRQRDTQLRHRRARLS